MGYRSDVAFTLPKADMDRLFEAAQAASHGTEAKLFEGGETPEELLQYADRLETDDRFHGGEWSVLHFERIKWYTSFYKDVDFVMDFLSSCEHYHYLRIGEDPADFEEQSSGSFPNLIGFRRELCLML